MNQVAFPRIWAFCGILLIISCSRTQDTPKAFKEIKNDVSNAGQVEQLQHFLDAVKSAERVIVYEGLPHHLFEEELLETELKSKKTIKMLEYPFYAEGVEPKKEDAIQLTNLLSAVESFAPFSGEKKCGGFHPDYDLDWHVSGSIYRAFVCFGCHEIKIIVSGNAVLFDLSDNAYDSLKRILQTYRKQRPLSKGS